MPRFKRKPILIEARQLTRENGEELSKWCGGTWHYTEKRGATSGINVPTLEGTLRADIGDWIVRGIKGEFHPIKSDIFPMLYEPAPHLVMICGVDCHPGDSVCNNYCNLAPQKGPMVKDPPPGPDAS